MRNIQYKDIVPMKFSGRYLRRFDIGAGGNLRGIYNVILCPEDGLYGVDIPKNVWHNVESLESRSVFFECKEGPFVPHEKEGVLLQQHS